MSKYEITEIEGVRIHEGTPEEYLVGITKATMERILKFNKHPSDCLALYSLYAYTAKWQKNSCAYATTAYVMKKFGWSRQRLVRAKGILKALALIQDEKRRGEGNKITGWFVKVNYAVSTSTEIHPSENPPGGELPTETVYSQGETINLQLETKEEPASLVEIEEMREQLRIFREKHFPQQPNTKR